VIGWGTGAPAPALPVALLPVTLQTLSAIRAEARRRGMVVVQQRRTMGRPPWYHVYAGHDGGRNLQQQAGDTTPEAHCLEGLPELLRWALRTWPDS
jgi:hypothetical protein